MMRVLRLVLFFWLIGLWLMGGYCFATQAVKYLCIEQGLSNNAVTCIYKDHYGFMWFGTYDGLNRYDGEKFKVFRGQWGNPNSLNSDHITAITEGFNKIFVGTFKGVVFYDETSANFTSLNYKDTKGQYRKVSSGINALVTSNAETVFIATESNGLLAYKGQRNLCDQVQFAGTTSYTVQALTVGKEGQLWLFIKDVGLCRYDKRNGRIQLVNAQLKLANCLLQTEDADILIGTEGGLFVYHSNTGKLEKAFNGTLKLSNNNVFDLKADKSGDLWIATNGGGVNIRNKRTGKITYLTPGQGQGSLRSGAISAIYEDEMSRKWVATLRGGVNVIESNDDHPFEVYRHDPFNNNSVINNFIISFCQDGPNGVWIGTDGGGMSYWDRQANTYKSYVHTGSANSLSSNFVVSVLKDHTGKLWVASYNGGIDLLDKASGTFKHYTCYNTATRTVDKNLWKLYEDPQGELWAGTTRGGALYRYDRAADQFELFNKNITNIHALVADKNTLWAGNYTQLFKIDLQSHKYRTISIGHAIRTLAIDKRDRLWIGTEGGGLLLYNTDTNTSKRYTQADGLPSNAILNILIDDNDDLWCSTYNGLSQFKQRTGKFVNYKASDGLQSDQFNYNAALKLSSGDMLFGGINGFNLFNPDSVISVSHTPSLRLTELKINNTVVSGNSRYTHGRPIADVQQINIPYNEATLAVDYSALEYSLPDKINYAYFLEGWDNGWNEVGKLKTAYYTRLNEGHYTLKIKATNTQGVWDGKMLIIEVNVLPPWYRTWWAYLLYVTFASLLGYKLWSYRSRQARLKFEIEVANMAIEREKELNEKKLSFFTNVSHEFRTPLTLIINPIKDLLNKSKEGTEELNVVYRNARRLLGLVDHLLLFRKAESDNAQMKISKVDFVTLCNEVFLCFTQQLKAKRLTYELKCDKDDIELYLDHEKIEIALFNLISNAVKFTPEGGNISIMIDEDEQNAFFKITDNGIGIANDVGDKLFSKFYQVREKNYFKTGFGIGLYLVKVFIDQHKGSISYHNNPTGGTTFVLSIPKGKAHFAGDQVFTDTSFDKEHVTALIDQDQKEVVTKEEEMIDLGLMLSNKRSVVIIDDNDQMRTYIKKLFSSEYKVFEANGAVKGLELIRTHLPDVIISDIVMEEMDGLELCKAVKVDMTINHIPIILLTGDATPEIMLQSMEGGAVDFISKPFQSEVLMARVKSVLRSRSELQNYFYKEVTLNNTTRNVSEENKDFLYHCISIIEAHLTNERFDVETLAKQVNMSYPTLLKKIKGITGQSVNHFVRFVRLRKAAELLIHTNCNVNDAAYRTGFVDIKYFREHFNKQFGVNPSEFIKKHRYNFQTAYKLQK